VSVLVDTNVLLRLAQPNQGQYRAATDGVARARLAGEALYVTPQNITEFWAAATRPVGAANGLGLTAAAVAAEIATIERLFELAQTIRRSIRYGRASSSPTECWTPRSMTPAWSQRCWRMASTAS
jgi:predicted nucleic acid-binding protein